MNRQAHLNYLEDLGCHIKELAIGAKRARDATKEPEDRAYAIGRLMAFHEVVSLMQQQASAFGLQLTDLCLADIEPERDLL
jgi:hypothetical protein